jgi:hypothetical protein
MAYIFGLILVGLFFVVLHYFTELTKSQKLTVTGVVLAIILGAIAYNGYNNATRDKMLQVVTKFEQGKSVMCDGKEVNATHYDLSVGTYTFIGREKSPHYGEMISASHCE